MKRLTQKAIDEYRQNHREGVVALDAGLRDIYDSLQDQREQWLEEHLGQLLSSAEQLLKVKALIADTQARNSSWLINEICKVLKVKRGSEG